MIRRLAIAALLLLTPAFGWAWGCTGHEVTALVAIRQLDPATHAKLDRTLARIPRDYSGRYCSDAELPALAYFSTWADDYRTSHKDTATWHYWNLPLEKSSGRAADDCEQGCILRAIREQLAVMKDRSQPQEERLNALLFVIHFVGDVHQPLHAEDNLDRGGNCVPVGFLNHPSRPRTHDGQPTADYSPTLHSIWDVDLVEDVGTVRKRDRRAIEEFANRLNHRYASSIKSWQKETDPLQWALESHQIARDMVYQRLPFPIGPVHYTHAVKDCSDGDTSANYLAKHEVADGRYVRAVGGTVERRLAAAGARLAVLLEANWPQDWN